VGVKAADPGKGRNNRAPKDRDQIGIGLKIGLVITEKSTEGMQKSVKTIRSNSRGRFATVKSLVPAEEEG